MAEYNKLVSQVLKNEHLVKAAKAMMDQESSALNLLAKDWNERLENDITFQDCRFDAFPVRRSAITTEHYDYQTCKKTLFNIILPAYCKFSRPYPRTNPNHRPAVLVSQSEPLKKIARVMTNDKGPVKISDEFKFHFKDCGILSCAECQTCYDTFSKQGFSLKKTNQPCICVTKIFNGKSVVNRFESHMEDMFPGTFVAILHLRINARYSYTDKETNETFWRISGIVSEMVAFHDAKLFLPKSVDLGELTPFEAVDFSEVSEKVDSKKSERAPNKDKPGDEFVYVVPAKPPAISNKNSDGFVSFEEEEDVQEEPPAKKPKVEEELSFLI